MVTFPNTLKAAAGNNQCGSRYHAATAQRENREREADHL
jgi:hypothetical protein